jgi:hypothetical protein
MRRPIIEYAGGGRAGVTQIMGLGETTVGPRVPPAVDAGVRQATIGGALVAAYGLVTGKPNYLHLGAGCLFGALFVRAVARGD